MRSPGTRDYELTRLIGLKQCQSAVGERYDQRSRGATHAWLDSVTDLKTYIRDNNPYLVGVLLLDQSRDRHRT
jgi:hypothetical protein